MTTDAKTGSLLWSVGQWVSGSVGQWICGSVDLWICGSVEKSSPPCALRTRFPQPMEKINDYPGTGR